MVTIRRETYYRDHWVHVEPERQAVYDQMFTWRPQSEPLIVGAALTPGQTVVDFGCGPGGLSVELARRVGETGRVVGVDLNAELIELGQKRAAAEGVADQIEWHQSLDGMIPKPDASADCVIAKNVLEYVDDVGECLADFRRVLRPGGRLHTIDSDWGLFVIEPLGAERTRALFEAARPAYNFPYIGRELHTRLLRAGFTDVQTRVIATPDTQGFLAPVIHNLLRYARDTGADPAMLDAISADVAVSVEAGEFFGLLPQFIVGGEAPA